MKEILQAPTTMTKLLTRIFLLDSSRKRPVYLRICAFEVLACSRGREVSEQYKVSKEGRHLSSIPNEVHTQVFNYCI